MAVIDGQRVRALESNSAWASKSQNNTFAGVQALSNPSSGAAIPNAQQKINDLQTDISGFANDILNLQNNDVSMAADIAALQALDTFVYVGLWNASTNSPTLADGDGGSTYGIGATYRVGVAGTQNLGSGSTLYAVGDKIVYNTLGVWEKWDVSDEVTSVNSQTGAVVLDTDDIAEGTALYFNNERAQDAIGGILIDTLSVDLDYNDGTNQITATVLPAGVDHDSLQNFVANKHINHASVSIATSATSGLNGGGDLTATRNLSVQPNDATAAAIAGGDFLLFSDISDSNNLKKATAQDIANLAKTTPGRETFIVAGSQQTFTLAFTPLNGSVHFVVRGGPPTLEGASYDFSVSGNVVTILNDLATGGVSEIVNGDIVQISYIY